MHAKDGIPNVDALYEPVRVGDLALRNRIVMSPMTREFATDGVLIPEVDDYYSRRAASGVGLIVTEGTTIDHQVAHYSALVPYFYGKGPLERWREVVRGVHEAGGAIFPQLWHTGVARKRKKSPNPELPSMSPSGVGMELLGADSADPDAVRTPSRVPPVPMTTKDIEDVILAFGQAAEDAKRIGFDGIAIHGAHGYLPDQFFWERSNLRTDRYGGSLENRMRFGVELIAEVRRRVGPDFPIMFRFSQWKGWDYDAKLARGPDELAQVLQPLADAGVDIFDASTRRFWLPEFAGSPLNLAGWAKKLTGKLAMTVGSVGLESPLGDDPLAHSVGVATSNIAQLMEMLERGDFDLVGVGRALIANPDWPELIRAGRFDRLKPYDAANVRVRLEQLAD